MLDHHELTKLAREMAKNIEPEDEILKKFKLTDKEFAVIKKIDFYNRTFESLVKEWGTFGNTAERIKLTSQAYAEELLPTLGQRALESTTPLPAVIETVKFFAKTGGLEAQAQAAPVSPTEKFVITINLGADQIERYEKEVTTIEHKPDGPVE